jgi:hypothetical protein
LPILIVLFVLGICGSADAQDAHRLTAAFGAGVARQFSPDFDFGTTLVWQASVRRRTGEHLAVEGVFEQWNGQRDAVHTDVLLSGPDGPIGRVARITEQQTYRMRTLAFNVLALVGSGRVTVAAGGGAGVMAYDRTYAQETSGCEPATSSACGRYENQFSSSSGTAQAVADLNVAITRRVAAFGRYDLVLPLRDPGFGHGSATAGIRVTVW